MLFRKIIAISLFSLLIGSLAIPRTISTANPSMQATLTYRLTEAFYENQQVYYYTFNNGTPVLDDGAEVEVGMQYRLVNAEGQPLEGQADIITANIWEEGYSDLREIVEVTVPDDYEVNSITNHSDLLAEDWAQNPTGVLRNIPLVRANSHLQGRDHDPIPVWLNDEELAAYDFGTMTNKTAPIYVLIEGFDPDGNPVRIDHIALIDVMHKDAGYSDFWQVTFVTVPADTTPNSFRKVTDLVEAGFEMEASTTVVNCPAIGLDEMQIAYYDDIAYNITFIPLDFTAELPADLPFIYTYVLEDGIPDLEAPLVLGIAEDDDAYTGYCEVAQVRLADNLVTNTADLLTDDNAEITAQGFGATCAYLSPFLPVE